VLYTSPSNIYYSSNSKKYKYTVVTEAHKEYDLTLELEVIQTQMALKPWLRAEVHAHALRSSQNYKEGSALRAGSIILPAPSRVETIHKIIF